MALTLGNSAKDSKYLKRIKDAIEGDKEHPRHHGIKMQAHHIISAEGMKRSGLGKKIEKFRYDINLLQYLVFIPCTLQGACYLGVQPHRGNHTALIEQKPNQDDYDDDAEHKDYHDMVSRRILDLHLPLSKECPGEHHEKVHDVQDKLNKLSKDISSLIQMKPTAAPLTNIAASFAPKEHIGCGCVDSVSRHNAAVRCAVERNHLGMQGPGQDDEGISYKLGKMKYKLTPGR